jgi:hypothetical protein
VSVSRHVSALGDSRGLHIVGTKHICKRARREKANLRRRFLQEKDPLKRAGLDEMRQQKTMYFRSYDMNVLAKYKNDPKGNFVFHAYDLVLTHRSGFDGPLARLICSLRQKGVNAHLITMALAEVRPRTRVFVRTLTHSFITYQLHDLDRDRRHILALAQLRRLSPSAALNGSALGDWVNHGADAEVPDEEHPPPSPPPPPPPLPQPEPPPPPPQPKPLQISAEELRLKKIAALQKLAEKAQERAAAAQEAATKAQEAATKAQEAATKAFAAWQQALRPESQRAVAASSSKAAIPAPLALKSSSKSSVPARSKQLGPPPPTRRSLGTIATVAEVTASLAVLPTLNTSPGYALVRVRTCALLPVALLTVVC